MMGEGYSHITDIEFYWLMLFIRARGAEVLLYMHNCFSLSYSFLSRIMDAYLKSMGASIPLTVEWTYSLK